MKKSYLMIAAAAGLMLAACSQEDDFVAQNAAAEQGDRAVLFDTYLSNTNTRAGQPGVMTTTTLQKTGFGIFANTHDVTKGTKTDLYPYMGYDLLTGDALKPDFMWNQYVGYEASNWIYSPIKYWPNETTDDDGVPNTSLAEDKAKEGVSFFAYAPYVNAKATDGTLLEGPATSGISALTDYDEADNPKVSYIVATGKNAKADDALQPSKSVDLLWGVSSGFSYHPVDTPAVVIEPAGYPVLNMLKPALDEKIKFDFKHALVRIGMKVVGAFDQQAAGGTKDDGTRVTIDSITVTSSDANNVFATGGVLNLNNSDPNRAEWDDLSYNLSTGTKKDANIVIDNGAKSEMNPYLKALATPAFPTVHGVLPTEQDVIVPSAKEVDSWKQVTVAANTVYNPSDGYFKGINDPITEDQLEYQDVETTDDKYLVVYAEDSINILDTKPAKVDLTTKVYEIDKDAAFTAITAGTRPAYVSTNSYFIKSGTSTAYTEVTYNQIPLDVPGTTYYTIPTATLTTAYGKLLDVYYDETKFTTSGIAYTYTTPGYFMVIPAQAEDVKSRVVTVTIAYQVTTKDAHLKDGFSNVKNVIKQDVTLKDFTNGKAYNLKLILGLTSVKVEAEVSNWEVGTVESNLPMNRE